ncbi:hypothetical protein RIF29_42175 [Crotalaria pallida]|uniref:F-box domain-containing protein n=1 Tax=Crotalaria pallida TaxID=3830 RepID=A0AAN9HW21_CROPI
MKKKKKEEEDRVSNLPDEVIYHILSYVDARTAAQTSVLSRRWRKFWSSLTVLNFNGSSSPFQDASHFLSFVDNFLFHRNQSSKVEVLRLDLVDYDIEEVDVVDSIIDCVTPKDISHLSIEACCVVQSLPTLSASRTLTTLKLGNISTETSSFNLASLEMLHLSSCRFELRDVEVLEPVTGCPNLRSLYLHDCHYYGKFDKYRIRAPRLGLLSIWCLRVDEIFDPDCVIELSTPSLRSFSYSDHSDLYPFSTLRRIRALDKFSINLGDWETVITNFNFSLGDREGFGFTTKLNQAEATHLINKLAQLFQAMGRAKSVSLSSQVVRVLSKFCELLDDRPSPFTRVKTFKIINESSAAHLRIPSIVMAYLAGASPHFSSYRRPT